MQIILPDFSQARVLVVGDLMLDRYWTGQASRISPEAPVPVVHVREIEDRPGGAGNVAVNVHALGAQAAVAGLVGDDEAGCFLKDALCRRGIDCRLLRVPGSATITKLRVLSRHQQLIRLDFEDGFDRFEATALEAAYRERLPQRGVVVLSDYAKGTLREVDRLIKAARQQGLLVLVDPKGWDFSRYRGATLLTPNESELAGAVGAWADEEELILKARRLVAQLQLEALLVTRSERGMLLVESSGQTHPIATQAREVFDVTGAGDTVIGVLAATLAAGRPLIEATWLANLAAGIVVGKLGTATVSVEELQAALEPPLLPVRGTVSPDTLVEQVRAARRRGERVVMTNGCFDLLHAGHVQYLQQARELGERLIVAVNDDDSVRRLKGKGRPITPLGQRMTVLGALACVDWVVPFSGDTPRELICQVLPDVLVKGGDYTPEQIAGADCVWAQGGEVRILEFVEGSSTTATVKRIRELSEPGAGGPKPVG